MDLLDQPEVKKTYEKCKYIVKVWEHKFVKQHNRLPSKLDIREATIEVRHAYRKYFQIKTTALEQSFVDVEGFEDEQDDKSIDKKQIEETEPNNTNIETSKNCIQPDDNLIINQTSSEILLEEKSQISEEVWGTHLNRDTKERKDNIDKEETAKPNLCISKKLFCGSKFSKRNPRKSLSFYQKTSKSDISVDNISLSQPLPSAKVFASFTSEEAISLSQEDNHRHNFQIVAPTENMSTQPINIVQSVLENNYKHSLKTIDTGWLERVVQKAGTSIDNPELPVPSLPIISNNPQKYAPSTVKCTETTKLDYDSDIIDESDDEAPTKDLFHIAKKRKVENNVEAIRKATIKCSGSAISQCSVEKDDGEKKQTECINTEVIFDSSSTAPNCQIQMHVYKRKQADTTNEKVKESEHRDDKLENKCNTFTEEKLEEAVKSVASKDTKMTKARKFRSNKSKPVKSSAKDNSIKNTQENSPRRSLRQTRSKINFQEFTSEEEDAFHTDTDEKDPEFSLDSHKIKWKDAIYDFDESTEMSKNTYDTTAKSTPKKSARKKEKVVKTKVDDEPEENKPYELEFSIKPRTVAPRCNIKQIISDRMHNKSLENKEQKNVGLSATKGKTQLSKERLEKKMASGNLNDNFVLVNLKKKVFVRGKRSRNFSKYKKSQWKSKQAKALSGPDMDMGGCDGGMLTCFSCGQIGHFSRNCKGLNGDGLLPLVADQEEECPYPTLEEASQMARDSVLAVRIPKMFSKENVNPMNLQDENAQVEADLSEQRTLKIDNKEECKDENQYDFGDDFISELLLAETLKLEENIKNLDVQSYMDTVKVVKPYFDLNEDNTLIETPSEVFKALKEFGHNSFRPGQEKTVMRILSGKSTLVTLSTGSGKSLCYQLPAYLFSKRGPCISLIVSPLVSLMDDQVTGIPKFIKAACLHSNQTKTQRQKILEAISLGELSILLVSPEAIVAGEKQIGFGSLLRRLPPIAFACIDEAHCVSQWSHNFRPSYLMICRVLRESLGVKTILGLTATATRATRESIIEHLQISDGHDGVISDIPLPDNLKLSVSKDLMRDSALLGLLMSARFSDCRSIIVYCTRRDECERVASFLRTTLKNEKVVEDTNKKRKRASLQAEPYHAGLPASRRRTIQNRFMSGELRIVVATIAFGMGINKSDIRAVIHYNMPNSFESYVQEVGRAGRDGLTAHCHVFMDSQDRDENELRRHIHANSIDRHAIRKLLQKVFVPCSCKGECPKHEVAFSIEQTVRALDVPEENISTLLCYLDLHEKRYIEILSPAYTMCKVISYGGKEQIRKAAKECPPLAMALAMHKEKNKDDPNVLEFPVIDVAAAMGWESGICKHKLKNLEWITVNNQPKRSPISVQFYDLGFRLLAPGNLSDDALDEALDNLYNRVVDQEQKALLQLKAIHKTLMEVAEPSYQLCISKVDEIIIKNKVREYFNSPDPLKIITEIEPKKFNEEQLVSDIHALICMYRDNTFTGRAVARILQGIQSPNYPATIWGRCKFWRSHLDIDFHTIVKIATREIVKLR